MFQAAGCFSFTAYVQYVPPIEALFVLRLNDDRRSLEQLGTELFEIVRTT